MRPNLLRLTCFLLSNLLANGNGLFPYDRTCSPTATADHEAEADERAGGRCYADQCLGAAYVTDRPNDKNSSVVLTLAPWAVDWSCADLLDFGFVMNGGEGRAERGQGPLRGSWAGRDRDRVSWQRRGPWQAGVVFPKEHGDFLSTPSDLRGEDLKGTQPERRLGENDRLRLSGRRLSSTI